MCDFPDISRLCIFFLLTFSRPWLLSFDLTSLLCFQLSILSGVRLLRFFRPWNQRQRSWSLGCHRKVASIRTASRENLRQIGSWWFNAGNVAKFNLLKDLYGWLDIYWFFPCRWLRLLFHNVCGTCKIRATWNRFEKIVVSHQSAAPVAIQLTDGSGGNCGNPGCRFRGDCVQWSTHWNQVELSKRNHGRWKDRGSLQRHKPKKRHWSWSWTFFRSVVQLTSFCSSACPFN